eukprot:sb/3479151/
MACFKHRKVFGRTILATFLLRLAGHAQRHPELTLHKVLLWEPTHGQCKRGRPLKTFVDVLRQDTGLGDVKEIASVMEERDAWRRLVQGVREFHPP